MLLPIEDAWSVCLDSEQETRRPRALRGIGERHRAIEKGLQWHWHRASHPDTAGRALSRVLVQWLNSVRLCVSCRSFFAIDLVYLLLYLLHAIDDAPHTRDCGENSKGHTTHFVYADEWNVCDLQQEIRAGGRDPLSDMNEAFLSKPSRTKIWKPSSQRVRSVYVWIKDFELKGSRSSFI